MRTWEEVFNEFETKYWAESGLGRLDPYPDAGDLDHRFLDGVETVNNENGILFLAFTLVHAYRAGNAEQKAKVLSYRPRIVAIIDSLRSLEGVDGLYNRQPQRPTTRTEAHDNYVGISALCALYDIKPPVRGMVKWAWTHRFCFNNVNPDKFEWAQFRQFGDIAVYYAMAGWKAPALFYLWQWVGLVIASDKEVGAGRTQLPWLRLWAIEHVGGPKSWKAWLVHKLMAKFWMHRLVKNWGSIGEVHKHYMRKEHPIHGFTAIQEANNLKF